MNKPSLPTNPHRLDAQAIHTFKEVAAEFAYFNSVAGEKNDVEGARASILTSILANAVDGPQVDFGVAPKSQQRADAFAAHLIWLSEASLLPGRSYLLKAGAQTVGAMVTELKYRLDINTLNHLAAKELHRNEIAFVNIATVEPINFDSYKENSVTGGFMLIERHSGATVAVGMIRFGLRRAANTYFQSFEITKTARARLNEQKPVLLWFTGLSGAGKSTIANNLERKLHALGKRTFVLDGDNIRHGLNRDLGFTEADRVENIRRVAEVAKLFVDAGLITMVAFISPFRAEREMARELVGPDEFVEIFVDTPLEICEQRDPKGLYRKARRGELRNFTGLDSPYERPESPELILDARSERAEDLADHVIAFLQQRGMFSYAAGRGLPIRICHLITSLDTGGAERSLVNLVTAMNRDEFENEVITLLKPGPMAQTLAQAGIQVTSMEIARHRPNPAALVSLIRHLRSKRPTILQTWLYHADFFGAVAAFFAKPEHLIWNVRSSEIDRPGIRRSTRYLARLLAALSRRPDAIVVNSHDGQRYHEQIGYRPKQWVNIANGVDLERFRPRRDEQAMLRTRLGIPVDAAVIGLVARYHPMKDIDTFLRAASRFRQDHENVKFVLCGDGLGPDNSTLTKLIRDLDLDRSTVLLGPRSDIELIYPALDVLTLCSIYGEGFPNVLCEAMACDVPCVATDVGDSSEIIGDSGLIVPRRDPQAIARAWHALLEKRSRLGTESARSRIVACYSLEKMCAHYESFYRSLAQKSPKARDWH